MCVFALNIGRHLSVNIARIVAVHFIDQVVRNEKERGFLVGGCPITVRALLIQCNVENITDTVTATGLPGSSVRIWGSGQESKIWGQANKELKVSVGNLFK